MLSLLLGSSLSAIELKQTPVRNAMYLGLNSDEWDTPKVKPKDQNTSEFDSNTKMDVGGKKSVFKAAAFSALLPGAGEYYVGNRDKAKYFFATEALTWIGFASFRIYGNWKKSDYIDYGNINASAQLDDKSDDFLDLVGFYESIDEYNSFGRVYDPERPYLFDTPENHWRWLSSEQQATYRELKNQSREAYRRSEFMLGVAIVTRVVSIVDAVRDAIRHNRKVEFEFSQTDDFHLKLDVDPLNPRQQVRLTISTPF
jgi:hypothetical protein